MPFDGSGNFIPTDGVRMGRVIFEEERLARVLVNTRSFDAFASDLADGLQNCLTVTGETDAQADISLNNNRLVNVQDAADPADAATLRQVLSASTPYIPGDQVGGTADAIVLEPIPAVTEYTVGLGYRFFAELNSTGAVTLAVSGNAPASVRLSNGAEITADVLQTGRLVTVVWQGVYWSSDIEPPVQSGFNVDDAPPIAGGFSLADKIVVARGAVGNLNRAGTLQQLQALIQGQVEEPGPLTAEDVPNLSADKITSGVLPVERGGTGATTVPGIFARLNVGFQRETRRDIFGGLTADEISSVFQQVNPGFTHSIRGMTSDGVTLWMLVNTFDSTGAQQSALAARAFTLATKARDAAKDIVDTGDILNNAGGGSGGAVIHNATHIWLGSTGSRGWMRAWTKQGVRAANLDFLAIHPGNPVYAAASDGSTAWITTFPDSIGTIYAWDLTASPPTAVPGRNIDKASLGFSGSDTIHSMATDGATLWIVTTISNRGAVLPWNLARAAADPTQDVPGDALPAGPGGTAYAGGRLYVGGDNKTGVVAYRFIRILISG